jgi:imidazole glycerol-phosphate synthase subunit HisH
MMYIAIIDYGMGNISSVKNSFIRAGADIKVTSDPAVIAGAGAVILPGVGAYRDAFHNLEKRGLVKAIIQAVREKPFLGICLGMQLLFDYSLEDGRNRGLGILKGSVRKIPPGVKIPHMGWNQVNIKMKESKIFPGIKDGEYFYFVHSYHAVPDDPSIISSTTEYGTDLSASVEKDNIFGFQFHPEKSSTRGQVLVKNFISLAEGRP